VVLFFKRDAVRYGVKIRFVEVFGGGGGLRRYPVPVSVPASVVVRWLYYKPSYAAKFQKRTNAGSPVSEKDSSWILGG
jgi:hypothetical protein